MACLHSFFLNFFLLNGALSEEAKCLRWLYLLKTSPGEERKAWERPDCRCGLLLGWPEGVLKFTKQRHISGNSKHNWEPLGTLFVLEVLLGLERKWMSCPSEECYFDCVPIPFCSVCMCVGLCKHTEGERESDRETGRGDKLVGVVVEIWECL